MTQFFKLAFAFCTLFSSLSATTATKAFKEYKPELSKEQLKQLKLSAEASLEWLEYIDNEQYGSAWSHGGDLFRITAPKQFWNVFMIKTRKPLGRVITRDVIDQRVAADPKKLPAGDYVVMIYNTTFANKPSATEIVTLRFEKGRWKVLTYQVK